MRQSTPKHPTAHHLDSCFPKASLSLSHKDEWLHLKLSRFTVAYSETGVLVCERFVRGTFAKHKHCSLQSMQPMGSQGLGDPSGLLAGIPQGLQGLPPQLAAQLMQAQAAQNPMHNPLQMLQLMQNMGTLPPHMLPLLLQVQSSCLSSHIQSPLRSYLWPIDILTLLMILTQCTGPIHRVCFIRNISHDTVTPEPLVELTFLMSLLLFIAPS